MKNQKILSLLLLVLLEYFVMLYCDIIGISPDYVQRMFGWTAASTGLVLSMVFIIFLFLGILIGNKKNQWRRKDTVLLSLGVAVVGMFLPFWTYNCTIGVLAYVLLNNLTTRQVIKAVSSLIGFEIVLLVVAYWSEEMYHYYFSVLGIITLPFALWFIISPITKEDKIEDCISVKKSLPLLNIMKMVSIRAMFLVSIICLLVACNSSKNEVIVDYGENVKIVSLVNLPCYQTKYHLGTNVHCMCESSSVKSGGLLGSAYSGIPLPEDQNSWNKIFKHLSWFGFNWIRLGFEHNDVQYEKGRYVWKHLDDPEEKTRNYKNMLHFLDWAEANNVDVLLQEFAQSTDWNCIPGQKTGHSAPRDLESWANGYVALVKHLVVERGYTCIKMLNISNEPENWWDWWKGRKICEGYEIVRRKLDAVGINIPLAGPEYMSDYSYTKNWEECKPYIGIFETHNYDDSHKNTIAFRPIEDLNYPTIWGEYAGGDNRGYEWNLQVAKWQVGGYNNGVDGFARWNFLNTNNIDGNFSYIITWDTISNKVIAGEFHKQPNLYHIDGLISRYVPRDSYVLPTSCHEENIIPAVFRTLNGNYSLLVVSQSETNRVVDFTFQGLDKEIKLYKYTITPKQKDKEYINLQTNKVFVLSPKDNKFTDEVSTWSMNVYSTFDLTMNENGIVEDGKDGNLEQFSTPLSENAVVIDNESEHINYSEYFAMKYVPGSYKGTERYSNQKNTFFEFTFKGDGFKLYGSQDKNASFASVYINDKFVGYANCYAPGLKTQMMTYDSGKLPFGIYRVKVVNENVKTITSKDCFFYLDAVALPSSNSAFM